MSSPEPAARPGAQQTPGAASSPPADARADAFGDDSEKLSGEALDRLVDAFHRGAARGSVYDRYSLGETLGTGGYAIVVRGVHKTTQEEVAVKIMRMPTGALRAAPVESSAVPRACGLVGQPSLLLCGEREALEADVMKEVAVLRSIDHPALLKMHEYYLGRARDKVYIVTELLRGGELLEALLERGAYSERDARTIFVPFLQGIAYLHSKRITHRDLKLENLLLADKSDLSSIRLADFGLARAPLHEADPADTMRLICGTPTYVAPEIVTGRVYSNAVDMWSAGVILFILLAGVVPFDDPDEQQLFVKIARGEYSMAGPEWSAVSPCARAAVRALLCVEPSARLRAEDALAHPWVTAAAAAVPATALPGAAGGLRAFAARLHAPPVRVYPAGALILRQGDPASEVLLLRSGTCHVILEDEQPPRIIATRGAGEFIGEMGVLMDARGRIVLKGLSEAASRGCSSKAAHREPAAAVAAALEDIRLCHAEAGGMSGGDHHAAADVGGAADATADVDSQLPSTPPSAQHTPPGGRRTASVVAVSDVEAVVLRAREVRWALTHDASVRDELVAAIEQRQRELRAARGEEEDVPGGPALPA